jgi:hypothetical protein
MPKTILMEQFHITVIAPAGLPKADYDAMQRTLQGRRFQTRLHDAVRKVAQRYASLHKVKIRIER